MAYQVVINDNRFKPFNQVLQLIEKMERDVTALVFSLNAFLFESNIDQELYKPEFDAAKNIVDNSYGDLYRPNIIALYTLLEGSIRDLIIALFKTLGNQLTEVSEVAKVEVSFMEYHTMPEDERYEYLYSEYEKRVVKGERYGLSRFNKLLSPLGINVQIDSATEKKILELAQIRNCLVHRGGIVDKRLLKECGWLSQSYNIGDAVEIKQKHFTEYVKHLWIYTGELQKVTLQYLTDRGYFIMPD